MEEVDECWNCGEQTEEEGYLCDNCCEEMKAELDPEEE